MSEFLQKRSSKFWRDDKPVFFKDGISWRCRYRDHLGSQAANVYDAWVLCVLTMSSGELDQLLYGIDGDS